MTYRIAPISKTMARQFITKNHRHNEAPSNMQVTLWAGLFEEDNLIGVATAGRPVARLLDDGLTLEVNRTCVNGYRKNANSMLYAAIGRAAKALGYKRLVTYTLQAESGSSLRASGFTKVEDIRIRSWESGTKVRMRYDYNLFGERRQAINQPKSRWERTL